MSTPPAQTQRHPLQERSQSQANTLAIRVVPYSPPRPESLQSPASGPSLRSASAASSRHSVGDHDSNSSSTRTKKLTAAREGNPSNPGSALSSSSSSLIPLAKAEDDAVSGSKLSSNRSEAGSRTPTTPVPSNSPRLDNIFHVNASTSGEPSEPAPQHHDEPGTASSPRPYSRRRNLISVHSDKTFSIHPLSHYGGGGASTPSPTPTVSSHERLSSDAPTDDRPSSPLTTIPDRSLSPATSSSVSTLIADDHNASSSPWNYRLVGGLRKVPKTPDLKQKRAFYAQISSDHPLTPLPEATAPILGPESPSLVAKASFQSSKSTSTTSETTNYKVYGSSSPVLPDSASLGQSSSDSNYELLGASSSPANYEVLGFSSSPAPSFEHSRPRTAEGDENYVVHGDPSPSSLVVARQQIRHETSQESIIIRPSRLGKKRSYDRFGYLKNRSRESLRHTISLKSISSVLNQEAGQAFLNTSPSVFLQAASSGIPGRKQDSWAGSSNPAPSQTLMEAHPHQWSSQLSTVLSESEGRSEPGTRSVSISSGHERFSSGYASNHSRQMPSISSSLAAAENNGSHSRSHSRSDSLDRSQAGPAYPRTAYHRDNVSGPTRLVRDQDEHGDGLTELHELQSRPSRTKLSGFFSSISSDRNIHSSSSSRANSFNSSSLPSWAKVYYGSGERKFLVTPSDVDYTEYDSSGQSSFQSGSPGTEHFPLNIHNARRRPQGVNPNIRPISNAGDMGISGMPSFSDLRIARMLRRQTSSIWSPHLRHDRRASRYSIWEPPSMTWSQDKSFLGRRNIQVASFMIGFIFPFAWMIAAFLPLPPNPQLEMVERGKSVEVPGGLAHRVHGADDSYYLSGKWWRALNRCMSIVGLLVIGAVVALVVIGIKQGWGQSTHH